MANDLARNPWSVDTASAAAILTSWADVRNFSWIGGTTSGHQVIVQDQSGRVIWKRAAQGANQDFSEEFEQRGRRVNGLLVPTLDSGTLFITFA